MSDIDEEEYLEEEYDPLADGPKYKYKIPQLLVSKGQNENGEEIFDVPPEGKTDDGKIKYRDMTDAEKEAKDVKLKKEKDDVNEMHVMGAQNAEAAPIDPVPSDLMGSWKLAFFAV